MYKYAGLCLVFLLSTSSLAANLPAFKTVRAQYTSSTIQLLDRNNIVLHQQIIHHQQQRLAWVQLNELSPALLNALLVSEDQRFYQHQGVDWRAIAGAAWENLVHNTHRGASTLTMQLAGLLVPSLNRSAGGRTYSQKWRQIKAAQQLEHIWSKSQILEAYLNLVDFRGQIIGINAASNALFDKTPSQINDDEASILSALLRGPNAKADIVAQRACGVARQLKQNSANCLAIQQISLATLTTPPTLNLHPQIAPEVAQLLLKNTQKNVISSLDYTLQNSLVQHLDHLPLAAAVILDNSTAEILAYFSSDHSSNQVTNPHDSETMLQPLIYASALTQKQYTAASLLDNTPRIYNNTPAAIYLDYSPVPNWVSLRTALSNTLNLPAQQVLNSLDTNSWNKLLLHLNLNTGENTVLALANAYQMLAYRGVYRPASFHIGGLKTRDSIYPANSAAIINDILTSNASTPAYHTLITSDSWAIGSDAHYTMALWIAHGDDVLNAWLNIENELLQHTPSPAPKLPSKLIKRLIRFEPAIEAPRIELFLPDTDLSVIKPPKAVSAMSAVMD
ncbi:MAG: hypothetical protein HOP20_09815 [Sulfuriferula sp.]|nr:hypothetical protein [Sulfuriferula sp.]